MKTVPFHFTLDCDWIPHSHKALPRLFDMIERIGLRPTFFLTGRFAEDYGEFVQEMIHRGYEIGSHGLNHGLDYEENFGKRTSYEKQKKLLTESTEIIARVSGAVPRLFRAPNLEISKVTFDVLRELHYQIDSSIAVRRFGLGFGRINHIHHALKPNMTYWIDKSLLEIPPSAYIFPLNMRLLRLFGNTIAGGIVDRIVREANALVFYVHPAEFLAKDEIEFNQKEKYFYKTTGAQQYERLESFIGMVLSRSVLPQYMSSHLRENACD